MPSPNRPEPPYYMVSFASQRTPGDNGHHEMGDAMLELARRQPGFLGFESCRDASGFGILNSFWTDEDSIRNWKAEAEHVEAQRRGRADWYAGYHTRIALVQRAYGFEQTVSPMPAKEPQH